MRLPGIHWNLLSLHFLSVVGAAYASHRANCLNVWDCVGDYSAWMTTAHYAFNLILLLRWLTPILFALFFFSKNRLSFRSSVVFVLVAALIVVATLPIYSGLIDYWERDWGIV